MREIIHLVNTETGYFYTTLKNKKKTTEKLKRKKYDPILRKHAVFVEAKSANSVPKKKSANKE